MDIPEEDLSDNSGSLLINFECDILPMADGLVSIRGTIEAEPFSGFDLIALALCGALYNIVSVNLGHDKLEIFW